MLLYRLAEEIGYEYEIQENTSIDKIRKEYEDGIIIRVSGSGKSPEGKTGSYRCVMDYKGYTKYIERELPEAIANQSMLIGASEAIECVNKLARTFLVSPIQLGFINGFKGKGVNANLVQEVGRLIKSKKCHLTEVQYYNGAEEIKKIIYSCNPDKAAGMA